MTTENGGRFAAFRDTLTHDELELVDRLLGMPDEMRLPFAIVTLRREIDRVRQPLWRTGMARIGYICGGLLAGLLATSK